MKTLPTLCIALGALTVAAVTTSPAEAAPPQACHKYASTAVNQYWKAERFCGDLYDGLRWQPDYARHHAWCIMPFVNRQMLRSETAVRRGQINRCRFN